MILLFSILLALAAGAMTFAVVMGRENKVSQFVSRRLRGGGNGNTAPKAEVRIERDDRYSVIPWFDRFLRKLDVGANLELLLYRAGMTMRPGVLVALMGLFAVGGYLFGLTFFHRLFPGITLMVLLAPVPYVYVYVRKTQRMRAFAKEFPDALDLLVSGLRAGLSFNAAMQIVADESPEPVRSEFAITVEEQQLGLDMRDALLNLTQRVDVLDLRFFVTAVLLQKETGGNLAEVLSSSASLIRDRFRVMGDIATFTAQGKMTAVILVALPMCVGLFTFMAAPDYFVPMITTEPGQRALWIAGLMQLAGVFVIRRIIQIKV